MSDEDEYKSIIKHINELELSAKDLERDVDKCENVDLILKAQIIGRQINEINNELKSSNISVSEKEQLNEQFTDLKDYIADIQVEHSLECTCRKNTKEESDEKLRKKMKEINERRGKEEMELITMIASGQIKERENKKKYQ